MLPIIIETPENTWTLIAENVKDALIKRLKTDVNYFCTVVLTGEDAPIDMSNAIIIDQELNEHIYIEAVNTTNASADFVLTIILYEI